MTDADASEVERQRRDAGGRPDFLGRMLPWDVPPEADEQRAEREAGEPASASAPDATRGAAGADDGRDTTGGGGGSLATLAPETSTTESSYSETEIMVVAAARQLAGERVCFVGVGPPNIACNLARRTVAPDLQLVYEAGVFGAAPARLPLSIGDPTLVTRSIQVTSMFDLFAYYLQSGLIDVGFLGASQIDRFGNINTTVIGGYDTPKVRLPGSGGACEIAINARKVFVIMPQSKRSFVEKIDFTTSPGYLAGARPKTWLGVGPAVVVTQLGVYRFDGESGEMYLASRYPGVSVDDVRENTGWDLRVGDLEETPAPTAEELRIVREELDPDGAYTR